MTRAWCCVLRMREHEAFTRATEAELRASALPPHAGNPIRMEVQMLRAVGLALQDDSSAALPIAVNALKLNASSHTTFIAQALCRLGHWKLGDLDSVYAVESCRIDENMGQLTRLSTVTDYSVQAAVELEQLRFSAAKEMALHAIECFKPSVRDASIAALPVTLVSQVLYEQGYLDEAENLLLERRAEIRTRGTIEAAIRAYPILARIAQHKKHYDEAVAILEEGEALGEERKWPRLIAASLLEQVDLWTEAQAFPEAHSCMRRLELVVSRYVSSSDLAATELLRYLTLARTRVALAHTPSMDDVMLLTELHFDAIKKQSLYIAVQITVRLVHALFLNGKTREALDIFFRALKIGSAVGLYQTFIDGGIYTGELLTLVRDLTPTSANGLRELLPYLDSLLIRWRARQLKENSTVDTVQTLDGLTKRERRVLELMSNGLSNKEIALCLGIAPETVKSHVKHLFGKLAVRSRVEAVSRASRLGFI